MPESAPKLALRIALLGLALLAVLVRPVYSTWCENHQLGHEFASLAHEQFRADSSVERQLDAEHARGAHGALHSDDGGTYAGVAFIAPVPMPQFVSMPAPVFVALPSPEQRVTRPFRPPIA
jgi:hypothetical protein